MKVWHSVWRIAHSFILLVVLAGMIAIGVFIGRPGEKGGNQSSLAGVDQQQQKRLAVFLDGTWNSVDTNTNVWRMPRGYLYSPCQQAVAPGGSYPS